MTRHGGLPRMIAAFAVLGLFAGCGDRGDDYPALLPTDQILAEPAIPGHAGIAATSPDQVVADLQSAGAALAVSAADVTAAPITDDAMIRRAAELRRRAAALSARDPACETAPGEAPLPGC
ncbi:MAG: hypothetical protein Q4G25_04735 [Paracoccus sp. (in: a-proteobacteria)]|nr:hypothetical protein [Paracoccus sp. (in: a-proteobacteria)]